MANVELEYVPLEKDGFQPLIVQFTNGYLASDRKGKKKEGLEFSYYRWQESLDHRKKHRRMLIAKSHNMEYTGQNFGQFARANTLSKYLVGILDNETGKMKIYDSEMFTMQPKLLDKEAATDKEDSNKELSFIEKSDRLTEAFGSSKKKRLVASRKKNLIDKEELNNSVFDAVQGSLMNAALNQGTQENEQSSSIPPFNIKAETPAEVYSLDDIISPSEYNAVKMKAKELQGANKELIEQWRKEDRFPEYILQHLAVMPLSEAERSHRSYLLLYLSYLMGMFKLGYKDFKRKDPLQGYPDVVKERLLSMFTFENPQNKNGRLVPKRLKDKLASYILVLALIIDEFVMDCMVIAKDLKITPQRISNHLRALGCIVASSGSSRKRKADGEALTETKSATLKVPLPPNFPNIGIR